MTSVRDEVSMATPEMGDEASHRAAEPGTAVAAVDPLENALGGNDESMISVSLYRSRRGHGVGLTSAEPAPEPPPRPTVLARTLALAHRLQRMLDEGQAKNRADLAAKLGFSRARVTQIMNLLWLAPDIQEEILFSVSPTGRDLVTTKDVRAIVRVMDWLEQRKIWWAIR